MRPMPGAALRRADETAVVALASFGDDAAFSELVKRRQSWLRNLLRRLCRDPTLSDDLAQQAFLQAWRSIRSLKSPDAFGTWLRRLAINTWLTHVRMHKATGTVARPLSHIGGAESTEDLTTPGNGEMGLPESADTPAAGEQLDLDRALARLSAAERLCIVLAYNEGMSHGEISETTGVPLGTVKSHIKRGTERLRRLLQAYRPIEAARHVE